MKKSIVYILCLLCYNSCLTQQKDNTKSEFFKFNLEEKETFTSDFYDILVLVKTDKSIFNIKEKITLSLGIKNDGVKDFLYLNT